MNTHRREFLKQASLIAAGPLVARAAKTEAPPVVETTHGKVRGVSTGNVHIFRGIPYGGDTSGKNRFMPPTKPAAWAAERDCTEFGHISPQVLVTNPGDYEKSIQWAEEKGGLSEDCLNLNVWAPATKGSHPVLVDFHGGGFTTGSGNLPGYDGEPMAKWGNVVVVNVNHRLGPLGYLYLGDIAGSDFAYSGVAGMMDCVQALEWVRDNIANFGGNPQQVFIFGQSGGGAKTSTLYSMPSAKGLFHRAAIQSGSTIRLPHHEAATKSAEQFLAKVGLDKSRISDLQMMPFEKLIAAGGVAGPMVDGKIIPRDPFEPTAPEVSAEIPVIIGTELEDAGLRMTDWDLTADGLKAWVKQTVGENADRALNTYLKVYPDTRPYLIKARMATDRGGRRSATLQAERKAAQGKAAAYLYRWDYPSPAYGGKFGAIHGMDVSLALHNAKPPLAGDNADSWKMAEKLSSVWLAFAKTGDPNNKEIPHWPAYNAEQRPTMIFNLKTRVENDPEKEIRVMWDEISARG